MKKILIIFFIHTTVFSAILSQEDQRRINVSEMKWELDYQIFLKLANDSTYNYDIRQLFHISKNQQEDAPEYIYYPVNLGAEYLNRLSHKSDSTDKKDGYKTLWSALHASLGGGWIHFTNCLLYSFETGNLSLTVPLMQRPVTGWKPKPATDTYLRTRKWKYYTPVNQKEAVKEYNLRKARNELGNLNSIPPEFVALMLKTSDKTLKKLREKGDRNVIARIELVKLFLGSNYLGEVQINYIRAAVLNAVKTYSLNKLPTVIVFDEFDAAAVMTLGTEGYKIDAIVFKNSAELSDADKQLQTSMIVGIIDKINAYNHNSFIKKLGNYYQK